MQLSHYALSQAMLSVARNARKQLAAAKQRLQRHENPQKQRTARKAHLCRSVGTTAPAAPLRPLVTWSCSPQSPGSDKNGCAGQTENLPPPHRPRLARRRCGVAPARSMGGRQGVATNTLSQTHGRANPTCRRSNRARLRVIFAGTLLREPQDAA